MTFFGVNDDVPDFIREVPNFFGGLRNGQINVLKWPMKRF